MTRGPERRSDLLRDTLQYRVFPLRYEAEQIVGRTSQRLRELSKLVCLWCASPGLIAVYRRDR